jgi:hypothetical protein
MKSMKELLVERDAIWNRIERLKSRIKHRSKEIPVPDIGELKKELMVLDEQFQAKDMEVDKARVIESALAVEDQRKAHRETQPKEFLPFNGAIGNDGGI